MAAPTSFLEGLNSSDGIPALTLAVQNQQTEQKNRADAIARAHGIVMGQRTESYRKTAQSKRDQAGKLATTNPELSKALYAEADSLDAHANEGDALLPMAVDDPAGFSGQAQAFYKKPVSTSGTTVSSATNFATGIQPGGAQGPETNVERTTQTPVSEADITAQVQNAGTVETDLQTLAAGYGVLGKGAGTQAAYDRLVGKIGASDPRLAAFKPDVIAKTAERDARGQEATTQKAEADVGVTVQQMRALTGQNDFNDKAFPVQLEAIFVDLENKKISVDEARVRLETARKAIDPNDPEYKAKLRLLNANIAAVQAGTRVTTLQADVLEATKPGVIKATDAKNDLDTRVSEAAKTLVGLKTVEDRVTVLGNIAKAGEVGIGTLDGMLANGEISKREYEAAVAKAKQVTSVETSNAIQAANGATLTGFQVKLTGETLDSTIAASNASNDLATRTAEAKKGLLKLQSANDRSEYLAQIAARGNAGLETLQGLFDSGEISKKDLENAKVSAGKAERGADARLAQAEGGATLTGLEVRLKSETMDSVIEATNSSNDLIMRTNDAKAGLLKLQTANDRAEYLAQIAAKGEVGLETLQGLFDSGEISKRQLDDAKTAAGRVVKRDVAATSTAESNATTAGVNASTAEQTAPGQVAATNAQNEIVVQTKAGVVAATNDQNKAISAKANAAVKNLPTLQGAERLTALEDIAGSGRAGVSTLERLRAGGQISEQEFKTLKGKAVIAQNLIDDKVDGLDSQAGSSIVQGFLAKGQFSAAEVLKTSEGKADWARAKATLGMNDQQLNTYLKDQKNAAATAASQAARATSLKEAIELAKIADMNADNNRADAALQQKAAEARATLALRYQEFQTGTALKVRQLDIDGAKANAYIKAATAKAAAKGGGESGLAAQRLAVNAATSAADGYRSTAKTLRDQAQSLRNPKGQTGSAGRASDADLQKADALDQQAAGLEGKANSLYEQLGNLGGPTSSGGYSAPQGSTTQAGQTAIGFINDPKAQAAKGIAGAGLCARFVRLALAEGTSEEQAVSRAFVVGQGPTGKVPTALDSENRFKILYGSNGTAKGQLQNSKAGSLATFGGLGGLKPGDVVFASRTDPQGHVGLIVEQNGELFVAENTTAKGAKPNRLTPLAEFQSRPGGITYMVRPDARGTQPQATGTPVPTTGAKPGQYQYNGKAIPSSTVTIFFDPKVTPANRDKAVEDTAKLLGVTPQEAYKILNGLK